MPGKKPTNLKIVQGTFRKDRVNEDEPNPEICVPNPPEHLSDAAKKEWDRISEELCNLGLLSEIDMAMLAAYCQIYGRWVDAEEKLKGEEIVITTQANNLVQNPLVGVANTALKMMRPFLVEFGMSPASRAKISAPKQPKQTKNKWSKK